ncbi:hypothetical protein EHO60_11675 [Leptospira fletcheri]|uniref:Uncharacterized protein n=1 Tax=Leptospira fletcheri TaxID=2484981 RepID=A0A4R9GET0_9LEPT|nr:hypothetical protein [Leptospira fletcheri]TGK10005.1 hypothetical protein EHO60_11675 [Leptospira fletcheri]
MLQEINASGSNNRAARQFSQSEFTIRNMPDRLHPLTNMDNVVTGPKSIAQVGVNTDDQALRRGYLIDLNA